VCRKNQHSKSVAIHRKQSFNKSNPWDHITRVHKTIPFFTRFWNYKPANSTATNSSFENLLPFAQTPAKIFEPLKKMLLREANLEQQQRSYKLFLLFFFLRNGQKNRQNNSNNPPNFPAPQKRFIMTCDYPQGGKNNNNNNNKPQDEPSAKRCTPSKVIKIHTHTYTQTCKFTDKKFTLFRVFLRQSLCSSMEACTNSSIWSTTSPKNVVDVVSDFFFRHEEDDAAAAAAGGRDGDAVFSTSTLCTGSLPLILATR